MKSWATNWLFHKQAKWDELKSMECLALLISANYSVFIIKNAFHRILFIMHRRKINVLNTRVTRIRVSLSITRTTVHLCIHIVCMWLYGGWFLLNVFVIIIVIANSIHFRTATNLDRSRLIYYLKPKKKTTKKLYFLLCNSKYL